MEFQTAVRTCFRKYAEFSGRARRAELWWFALFTFVASLILGFVDSAIFGMGRGMGGGFQPLGTLFSLAVLLPSLAVGARRLHDIGRSGWWLLIGLVPIIGILVLIWWYIQPGDVGPNQYGPDPLGADPGRPA
jgi:uncharacterized membrane protein YhaH (DUF805 family)